MNCTASVQAPAEGAIHSTSVRVEGGCQSEPLSPALSPPDGERERAAAEPSTNCQRNWRLSGTALWSMTLKRKVVRGPAKIGGGGPAGPLSPTLSPSEGEREYSRSVRAARLGACGERVPGRKWTTPLLPPPIHTLPSGAG